MNPNTTNTKTASNTANKVLSFLLSLSSIPL